MENTGSLLITYALLSVLFGYFLLIAIRCHRKNDTYFDYFLANRQLGVEENAVSYFARFTSLATVLTFFFIFTSLEGLYILISPITVVVGVLLFNRLSRKFKPVNASCSSIVEYLDSYYNSLALTRMALFLFLLGVLLVLLIEIYVGSKVLEAILPLSGNGFVSVMVVGVVVFMYVAVGGLRSIVATDRVQVYAMLAFVLVACASLGANLFDVQYSDLFPRSPISLDPLVFILPLTLMLNVFVVNMFLFPSLYSTWQMRFATTDNGRFLRGNAKGALSVLVVWSVFIVVGLLLKVEFGNLPFSLGDLAVVMTESESVAVRYLVGPLLVVAAVAALFSTADSGVIPIIQMIYDKRYDKKEFNYAKTGTIAAGLAGSIFALYFVVFVLLEFDFINAMFSVFGFSVILSPVILWSVVFPNDPAANRRGGVFLFGIVFGLFGMGAMIALGAIEENTNIVQLAPVIGFTFVMLVLVFSYIYQGSPQSTKA